MANGTSVDINPAAALTDNAHYFGADIALRYEGQDLTYTELEDRVAQLAGVLSGAGVRAGDRVAYVGLNSAAFLTSLLAAVRLGAIFVPANFRLSAPELGSVLTTSGATVIITEPGHVALVDQIRERTAAETFLLIDDDPAAPLQDPPATGWAGWSALLASAEGISANVPADFADPAVLMFTSGTTGLPKGVILTHGNLWWNSVNVDARLDARRGDVTYASAPLFHIGTLNSFVLRTVVRGGTVVIRRTFNPDQFLADLVSYQVNSMFTVSAMLHALQRVPGLWDADLAALRSIVVAGAPVPPSQIKEFFEHGVVLQQAWGLTETAPFATHLPREHTMAKIGSCGIPMPYTQVQVVDISTGKPCAPGEPGELVVRGPNVAVGYWENPEATAAAFDADGWFHSGDIGHIDSDGYLYVVDRLKDMIISGGENVYPAEVERVLSDLPGLTDVAVVGVADQEWGEAVVAVCSVAAGCDLTLEEVREHASVSLARYKVPRQLRIVDAVPRNASGKLDKHAVRQLVGDQ